MRSRLRSHDTEIVLRRPLPVERRVLDDAHDATRADSTGLSGILSNTCGWLAKRMSQVATSSPVSQATAQFVDQPARARLERADQPVASTDEGEQGASSAQSVWRPSVPPARRMTSRRDISGWRRVLCQNASADLCGKSTAGVATMRR